LVFYGPKYIVIIIIVIIVIVMVLFVLQHKCWITLLKLSYWHTVSSDDDCAQAVGLFASTPVVEEY